MILDVLIYLHWLERNWKKKGGIGKEGQLDSFR